jgi:hypothetical protein
MVFSLVLAHTRKSRNSIFQIFLFLLPLLKEKFSGKQSEQSQALSPDILLSRREVVVAVAFF